MICAIYKWLISEALNAGHAPSGVVQRHIGRCRHCREFYAISAEVGARLRTDAAEAGRILAPGARPVRPPAWLPRPGLAFAAAACLVIGVAAFLVLCSSNESPTAGPGSASAPRRPEPVAGMAFATPMSFNELADYAWRAIDGARVDAEIENLAGDATAALRGLASNLPMK